MGVKYECREIGESDWRECTEDEYLRYSAYPETDTRVVGRFSSNSGQPQNLPKIIGRFEPIGKEVGRPRAAFDVLTKGPYEFKGRQGFKGFGSIGAYSVISEHWQFVPLKEENV